MAKFNPGQIVATRGVVDLMEMKTAFHTFVNQSLVRHLKGDWGDICEEDKAVNDAAVTSEDRILSAYKHPNNPEWHIWIITEWDRSATTILFPDEY